MSTIFPTEDQETTTNNQDIEQEAVQAADRVVNGTEVHNNSPVVDTTSSSPSTPLPIEKPKKKFKLPSKKVSFALVAAVLISGIGAAFLVFGGTSTPVNESTSQARTVQKMGAELIIADGAVQQSQDNATWAEVKAGAQIAEGSYVKTNSESRAVIGLDDGSAIRINSNSVVKVDSLDSTDVKITNENGTVYTRVVPSDRQFSVAIADETYKALGTAYITTNTETTKGVEVYHSKVSLTKTNVEVPEGKYYYTTSSSADTTNKVGDIPVDKVQQDSFLAWNYEQDKKVDEFKDKLGYLTKIDEKTAAASTTTTTPAQQTGSITLKGVKVSNGVKLTWQVSNVSAPMGFKIVKSGKANPVYPGSDYKYASSPDARSYTWSISDGGTYHFRVCIYTGGGCSIYSNDVVVTAPKTEDKKEEATGSTPSGSTALTHTGGKNFSWTLNGSAPHGFKLVWSTNPNPVYPGNDYQYYSSSETRDGTITPKEAGTYNVRVCIYTGGGCTGYSNQLTVTVD